MGNCHFPVSGNPTIPEWEIFVFVHFPIARLPAQPFFFSCFWQSAAFRQSGLLGRPSFVLGCINIPFWITNFLTTYGIFYRKPS